MMMLRSLIEYLIGCTHRRTTLPITLRSKTYIVCLDCGKEIPYNW